MEDTVKLLKGRLEDIEHEVDTDFGSRWDSEKRSLVPGSSLLDEIFKHYGLRFQKLRDGPALASRLSAEEIDAELAAILRLF